MFVLDGEVLWWDEDAGRPRAFQDSMSSFGRDQAVEVDPHVRFFDVLHVDGEDLLYVPAAERFDRLAAVLPERLVVPRIITSDPAEAASFFDDIVARGHEGVVVKDLASTYDAGRRGSSWLKVKPRHTLDLVVLAVVLAM